VSSRSNILVSVCLITYNQEQFISEAIESALMQEADFKYEIVISDDCSTDRTREICETYQQSYPDVIRLLPKTANVGLKKNFVRALTECQGKYIAYLEGDDKWTSPHKLAKQADVMEHDEGVVLVHTDWVGYDVKSASFVSHEKFSGVCIREVESGIQCVAGEFQCTVRYPRGSAIFFRKVDAQHCIDNDQFAYITSDFPAFDFLLYQDLSVMGRFYFIDEVMLTVNLHDSLSGAKDPLREFDFRRKALFAMGYYINKYSVPDNIKKLWARRQLHYFVRFPFDTGLSNVKSTVLSLVDFIVGMGGVPTFRQRILIWFTRNRYCMWLFSMLYKKFEHKKYIEGGPKNARCNL
jgi:glycosyltransferase involved in cell wall biosynthesis